MSDPGTATAPSTESAWAPLRVTVFRNLWLALLVSNIGTWMQTVGAQWLLVDEPNAGTLVAVVQTATLLPALLLALPAGALADSLDRRGMLISVQLYMFAVGATLAVLTAVGEMPPALLLTLTFGLGVGQALTVPTWQALVPELVPRRQLHSASALGAISVNVARAIGPATAGVLIVRSGVATVFTINAVSFLLFAAVLVWWRPDSDQDQDTPERFRSAMRAGGRYVRHSPVVRRILLRAALFLLPGSALWALLPLVATERLGLRASGYGMLLGALGVGAIVGALILPPLRARLRPNRQLVVAGVLFALSMATVSLVRVPIVVMIALLPAGMAWVLVLSTINATIQLFLPRWVRARGLSIYQIVFAGAQAVGALLWGVLADAAGVVYALVVAAVVMLTGAATIARWPLRDIRGMSREPAVYWNEPDLSVDIEPDSGPIVVLVTYTVRPEHVDAFTTAMGVVRRSRLRTGASRWGLFRHGEVADEYLEVYLVPSWGEHLRQHYGRLTGADQAAEEVVHDLVEGTPRVAHLLAVE